jgi:hypothetical protein
VHQTEAREQADHRMPSTARLHALMCASFCDVKCMHVSMHHSGPQSYALPVGDAGDVIRLPSICFEGRRMSLSLR